MKLTSTSRMAYRCSTCIRTTRKEHQSEAKYLRNKTSPRHTLTAYTNFTHTILELTSPYPSLTCPTQRPKPRLQIPKARGTSRIPLAGQIHISCNHLLRNQTHHPPFPARSASETINSHHTQVLQKNLQTPSELPNPLPPQCCHPKLPTCTHLLHTCPRGM